MRTETAAELRRAEHLAIPHVDASGHPVPCWHNPDSLTTRVWDYARETGQDVDTVRIKLLTVISLASPEVVDAAFAELRTQR